MKRNQGFGSVSVYMWILIVGVCMSGCCKDEVVISPYFRCELNGEACKTYNPVITFPNGTRYPRVSYNEAEGYRVFYFHTHFRPKQETTDTPHYYLTYYMYPEDELAVGKKYYFSVLPETEEIEFEDERYYHENRISYVKLSMQSEKADFVALGTGYVQITEISEDDRWIKGKVELEFGSDFVPAEMYQGHIKLKGEFRSVFNTEHYVPHTD